MPSGSEEVRLDVNNELQNPVQEDTPLVKATNCMGRLWKWIKPENGCSTLHILRGISVVTTLGSTIAAAYLTSHSPAEHASYPINTRIALALSGGSLMLMGFLFSMKENKN